MTQSTKGNTVIREGILQSLMLGEVFPFTRYGKFVFGIFEEFLMLYNFAEGHKQASIEQSPDSFSETASSRALSTKFTFGKSYVCYKGSNEIVVLKCGLLSEERTTKFKV